MIPEGFTAFVASVVGACGGLVGLLFVAVSLAPRRQRNRHTTVVAQTQAAGALLSFTNPLIVALLALLPEINGLGRRHDRRADPALRHRDPARRAAGRSRHRLARAAIACVALGLLIIGGFQLWANISLIVTPHQLSAGYEVASAIVASLVQGIARAWQPVGLRSTGFRSSLDLIWHGHSGLEGILIEDPDEPQFDSAPGETGS